MKVDRSVYTRLLRDMLTLLVLPATDGAVPELGGFVALPLPPAPE